MCVCVCVHEWYCDIEYPLHLHVCLCVFHKLNIPCECCFSCASHSIHQVVEVQHVCNLPCLEHFLLSSNPITNVVDYRTKVLELFEERFTELNLDGQKATEKEKVSHYH